MALIDTDLHEVNPSHKVPCTVDRGNLAPTTAPKLL